MSSPRRNIGYIRKLPSGRFSVNITKFGVRVTPPHTFTTYTAAEVWCYKASQELWQMKYQQLIAQKFNNFEQKPAPTGAIAIPENVNLDQFAREWLLQNNALRVRTRYDYQRIVDKWFAIEVQGFKLSDSPISKINAHLVSQWIAELSKLAAPSTIEYCFRLLKVILNAAFAQGLISTPPTLTKFKIYKSQKRPLITTEELRKLAELCPSRYSLSVLIAGLCGLRSGEIFALQRKHIDLKQAVISVEQAVAQIPGKGIIFGPPKSSAGVRNVTYPEFLQGYLVAHLHLFVDKNPNSLIFTTENGKPITIEARRSWWDQARADAQLPHIHFHDLRHLAATLAAQHGASMAELQARLGHSSINAAMRYQHATPTRDRAISAAIDRSLREPA